MQAAFQSTCSAISEYVQAISEYVQQDFRVRAGYFRVRADYFRVRAGDLRGISEYVQIISEYVQSVSEYVQAIQKYVRVEFSDMAMEDTFEMVDREGDSERLTMRVSWKKGNWRMGCLLLSPVSGEAKFTPDVLRRTNLTSAVREALNARLREDVHGYIQLSTKKAVRQRMHAWVLAEREADPELWPSYGRKGPRPVGELDGTRVPLRQSAVAPP